MKQVLSIQDLSCVGRCSLTVALPVLSAMGCQCSVLPTAVLSSHTGFPAPSVIPMTAHIQGFFDHWKRIGAFFDTVTTGYLSDPGQVDAVLPLLRHYRSQGSTIIADPAMGDHGKLYSRMTGEHVQAMKALCRNADILLPNVTEAALLTGLPYREETDEAYLQTLSLALLELGCKAVMITGVSGKDGTIGFFGMHRDTGCFSYSAQAIPRQFHGTGDLFAAVFAGSLTAGKSLPDSGILAADFVRRCVAATETVTPYGVEFEAQLPWLCAQNAGTLTRKG